MKKSLFALSILSSALMGGSQAYASVENPIHVVASFTVLADVVKAVGGDLVEVKSLVPVNGDPHDFSPTPKDAQDIKHAAATFVSGEGLETWFTKIVKASGSTQPAVMVSKGIKIHMFNEDGHKVRDPHVWNSIPNVMIWVKNIESALAKVDPNDAATYKINAAQYLKQLDKLNKKIHHDINNTPKNNRKVLTSHDAFGYYANEYGVSFMAPVGVSTETEATASRVAKLIDQIKKEHITTYFLENSNSARLIKQIAHATGAKPGGELYPEALSSSEGPASTYLKMMAHNTDLIVSSLKK